MDKQDYALIRVETEEQWQAYHAIRRQVLFERGYDPNHPDDRAENNHPVLLFYGAEPVGAMRIDLVAWDHYAIMRTVAIRKDQQRRGRGTIMLRLAEEYALRNGCTWAVTVAANEAVGFYRKCGYEAFEWDPSLSVEGATQMRKRLEHTPVPLTRRG